MDLKQRISSLPPSENSGARVSNRFDFQKNWAICKLLELHKESEDYLLTFEHHDDVLVFNSSTNPTKVSFYQIKTADKTHWTLNSLLKHTKSKKGIRHSFLGKLYEHLVLFHNDTEYLFFVTNCKLDGKLKDNTSCDNLLLVKCRDFSDSEKNLIESKIKTEYNVTDIKNFTDTLCFRLNELSIIDHVSLTKGKLSTFLDDQFPELFYQISPLYRAIFDEVKLKTDFEPSVKDFDTLRNNKSITRIDFEKHLNTIHKKFSEVDSTSAIENRLNTELVSISEVSAFKRNVVKYRMNKMSYNNRVLNLLNEEIKRSIKSNKGSFNGRLYDDMLLVFNELKSFVTIEMDSDYIKCVILFHIYEG